jgi:Ca-activated chloride channel family protein
MIDQDPFSSPRSSLTAGGKPVPLLGVAVSGTVLGAHARLVVRQRYRNAESAPIEAVYTFPLPSDAVLVGFAMECEGHRVEGEVKEREAAFEAYDEAISKGHGATLLDQERANVFTASVGNLLPGEETVIETIYVQRLTADEGALRLAIPTLVAPRYMPGSVQGDRSGHGVANPTDRVPDADRISPAIAAVSYGLTLDLVFDLGRAITVESPSHSLSVRPGDGHRVRVEMSSATVPLDRDVVILASGAGAEQAGVVADRRGNGEGTFALTVVPDLFRGERAAAHDVVFLVDVSGSMDGDSIEQARAALRLCLRHLSEGDRFSIIAFESSFRAFQPKLVPFTQKTLESADRWVAALSAGGGTELLEPLLAAASTLSDGKREGIVVLLTDGQVGNEAEIVEKVVARLGRVRIYGFGIGTSVSDLLLNELARRSKGAAEFIHPGERIDAKVTAQFARATAARVEDLSLSLVGIDGGELTPADLPPLVDGEPWVVYGRYEKPCIGSAELRGTLRGEPWHEKVVVDLLVDGDRPALASLWAASRVRDLETGEAALDGRRREAQKKRIVALAVEHGIASNYTSFVVVEKRTGARRTSGMPETRPVPVSAPAGWAMTRGAAVAAPGMPLYASTSGPPTGAPAPMAARAMMGGAMPQAPAAMAPPSFGPPPALAPQAAGSSRGSGGVIGAIGGMVSKIFGRSEETIDRLADEGALFERAESDAAHGDDALYAPAQGSTGDLQSLFERQLASGLWEGDAPTDAARLLATARVFSRCFDEGVDTGHALFGAPLKKAIAAIRDLAKQPGKAAERELAAALAAAYLVASGSRLRGQIVDAARASGVAGVRELAAELTGTDAAKRKVDELLSG